MKRRFKSVENLLSFLAWRSYQRRLWE